jgi:hypothetical protein
MRFRDKNGPLHHPIFKPANLPDFLTVARSFLIFGLINGVIRAQLPCHSPRSSNSGSRHLHTSSDGCAIPLFDHPLEVNETLA